MHGPAGLTCMHPPACARSRARLTPISSASRSAASICTRARASSVRGARACARAFAEGLGRLDACMERVQGMRARALHAKQACSRCMRCIVQPTRSSRCSRCMH
eukprot:6201909-Pleurochrysis_carterae.AAC.1